MDFSDSCVCLSLPALVPEMVLDRYSQVLFEDFNFNAWCGISSASMLRETLNNDLKEQGID